MPRACATQTNPPAGGSWLAGSRVGGVIGWPGRNLQADRRRKTPRAASQVGGNKLATDEGEFGRASRKPGSQGSTGKLYSSLKPEPTEGRGCGVKEPEPNPSRPRLGDCNRAEQAGSFGGSQRAPNLVPTTGIGATRFTGSEARTARVLYAGGGSGFRVARR